MKNRWIAAAAALCAVVATAIVLAQRETPAPVIQKNTESRMPSSASGAISSVPSVSGADVFAFQDYMNQKAGEVLREKNLAYDEGVIFEEQGLFWEVDGAHELTSLAAVQKQYPQAALKEEYHGYRFSSLTVNYQSGEVAQWNEVGTPKHAPGEVFRRDVSLRSADSILATYSKGKELLSLNVMKRQYLLDPVDSEDILTGRQSGYTLLKMSIKKSVYFGFYYQPKQGKYAMRVTPSTHSYNVADGLFPQPVDSGTGDERTTRQNMLNLLDTLDVKGEYNAILKQYGLP